MTKVIVATLLLCSAIPGAKKPPPQLPSACIERRLCITGLKWSTDNGRGNWIVGLVENGTDVTIDTIILTFTIKDGDVIISGATYIATTPIPPGENLAFRAIPQEWREFSSFTDTVKVSVIVAGGQRGQETLQFDRVWTPYSSRARRAWERGNMSVAAAPIERRANTPTVPLEPPPNVLPPTRLSVSKIIATLKQGQTFAEVTQLLGKPEAIEPHSNGELSWYYGTPERVRINFIDGKISDLAAIR